MRFVSAQWLTGFVERASTMHEARHGGLRICDECDFLIRNSVE